MFGSDIFGLNSMMNIEMTKLLKRRRDKTLFVLQTIEISSVFHQQLRVDK